MEKNFHLTVTENFLDIEAMSKSQKENFIYFRIKIIPTCQRDATEHRNRIIWEVYLQHIIQWTENLTDYQVQVKLTYPETQQSSWTNMCTQRNTQWGKGRNFSTYINLDEYQFKMNKPQKNIDIIIAFIWSPKPDKRNLVFRDEWMGGKTIWKNKIITTNVRII